MNSLLEICRENLVKVNECPDFKHVVLRKEDTRDEKKKLTDTKQTFCQEVAI